jgi:hypothetical protein
MASNRETLLLMRQKERIAPLVNIQRNSSDFKKWKRDTQIVIERVFGEGSRHISDFDKICYSLSVFISGMRESAFENAYIRGLEEAEAVIDSFIDEVEEFGVASNLPELAMAENAQKKIERICTNFHSVCRQIRRRYADRPTIDVKDEYDVQDIFHALLLLDFDDVRPEEYSPSYAGSASRIDFVLKSERIAIELKMTRKSLSDKEVGNQLTIDIARYESHPSCDKLICFVYDPDGWIKNPRGLEADIKVNKAFPTVLFISP